MADRAAMRLGHTPSGPTPHLPAFGAYASTAHDAPPTIDWSLEIDGWPLLANDTVGDCSLAGALHYVQAAYRWRDGTAPQPRTEDALAGYRLMGWNGVGEGAGVVLADLLARWFQSGLPWLGGTDQIEAFARVDPQDLRQALHIFGPLIVGCQMPVSAQQPGPFVTPPDLVGDNAPGSWGGHCMLLVALAADGTATFVTWGETVQAEAGWVWHYLDEAWAVVHPVWSSGTQSPSGFPVSEMIADLAAVS